MKTFQKFNSFFGVGLPKHLRAIPLTPFFCLAAILLFLLEIAERRFLLIGRFFPAKQKKPDATDTGKGSGADATPGFKPPRKRGKAQRAAAQKAGLQPASTAQTSEQHPAPGETPDEPEADSISAALRKARRR